MPEPQPSPEAQVIVIRAALIDTYGEDYAGEDAGAEVERLFRHLGEHEANVQRILQAKNEALERAQAQVVALLRELAEAREVEIALNARKTAAILEAMERADQAEADREEEARSAVSLRRERDALKAELAVVKRNWKALSESITKLRKEVTGRKEHGEQVAAELAEARAAIADVRRLCELTIAASCRVQAIEQARDTLAVLDARESAPKTRPVSVESPGNDGFRYEPVNAPDHVDSHGRSWDRHPFVKSSRVGDDVAVCVCGQPLEHEIHAPETPGDAE